MEEVFIHNWIFIMIVETKRGNFPSPKIKERINQ